MVIIEWKYTGFQLKYTIKSTLEQYFFYSLHLLNYHSENNKMTQHDDKPSFHVLRFSLNSMLVINLLKPSFRSLPDSKET